MKKLFRIHFAAIVVSDLLLLVTFRPRYELSLERGLIFLLHFHPCSRTTAISLGQSTQKTVL